MNSFAILLHSTVLSTLGWTLIHFLWQGAAVGVLYAIPRRLLRTKSPVARYNLAMLALISLTIFPIITFIHLFHAAAGDNAGMTLNSLTVAIAAGAHSNTAVVTPWFNNVYSWLRPLLSWAVVLWFAGVLIMTVRIGYGWQRANYLRRTANFALLPQWDAVVRDLSTRLGIHRLVSLAVSINVHVPSVIGWLKPVILLPPSVISGLTPLQIELILAHELAHVRRYDYLWNLLQVIVETLLFYHPVVRWISNHARVEREQCCDDMVVALHGSPLAYARALTELEGLRHSHGALLLGANGGQVLDRIHRLLGRSAANVPVSWMSFSLAASLLLAVGLVSTGQINIPWRTAVAAKYTLTGQPQDTPPVAAQASQINLLPTHISQTLEPSPQPETLRIPSELPAVRLANLAAPIRPNLPALPQKTAVAPVQPETPQPRSGGEVIARYAPVYPAFAQERGVEGNAKIEFTLTPDAEITDVRVVNITGSQLFGQAASEAIRKWKFTPVLFSGKPVAQQMTVDFVFSLHADSTQGDAPCKAPMGYHVCLN